jgi:hypothetical protein
VELDGDTANQRELFGRASPKFPGLVTGWVGGQRFCGLVMSA